VIGVKYWLSVGEVGDGVPRKVSPPGATDPGKGDLGGVGGFEKGIAVTTESSLCVRGMEVGPSS
jgi:hypothetical protein